MATHSSVLAWRIPGMGKPGGLPSMGSHGVGHDWSDLAAAAHASNVMPKILQASLQQYVNKELPYVQAGFRKGRGTRDQTANSHWISEKSKKISEKYLLLLYWLCQSLWLCGSQQNVKNKKFFKRWEYQTTLPASWETCMQVKKQQSEPDVEQWTGSKLGKEHTNAVYCHHAYLT